MIPSHAVHPGQSTLRHMVIITITHSCLNEVTYLTVASAAYFEAAPVDRLHRDGFGMDDSHVLSATLHC